MAHITEDRVIETSTTTGTGNFTVAGALTGFRTFASVMATNDTCFYAIWGVDANGNATGEFEDGLGTYSATNTLTRTTVYKSSNAGSAVSFSAGTKYVSIAMIAKEFQHEPTKVLASDSSQSTTAGGAVTGMSFEAAASATYEVEFVGVFQSAATTTGMMLTLDIPNTGTVCGQVWHPTSATALASCFQIADNAVASGTGTPGVLTATSDTPVIGRWIVTTAAGGGGTVALNLKSEVASSAVTLKAGRCMLKARRIV